MLKLAIETAIDN